MLTTKPSGAGLIAPQKGAKEMKDETLERYWRDIPTGKANAIGYKKLRALWKTCNRGVRQKLHELSAYDNGDGYILIRSAHGSGFYRTNNAADIAEYRQEVFNKGKSIFAPLKKIDRVLRLNGDQERIAGFEL